MDATRTDANFNSHRAAWWPVLAVLLLAVGVRAWVIARSEVAARDSVGFITTALRLESEPIGHVVRTSQQPPGYPLAVLVASWPVRAWTGGVTPAGMTLAAQLASAFFGVLIVLPMIGFGSELFDRRVGCVAAGLFQCLPSWIRITSDGLSESLFLFMAMTALWLAARAWRTESWKQFMLSGVFGGLAYLTRPEGAEIIAAICLVLFGSAVIKHASWRPSLVPASAVVAGFLVCFGPFFATTGRVTNKPTGIIILGKPAEKTYFGQNSSSTLLAVWWQGGDDPDRNRSIWAFRSLIGEVADSSRYIGLVASIIGIALWNTRIRNKPAGAALLVLTVMHCLLLIRMTASVGYLSERHVAMIVMTGCFPSALAVVELTSRFAVSMIRNQAYALTAIVALAFLSACPSLSKPLHGNRAGHKAAGEWLATHAEPHVGIRDPFCWGRYYAGRDFVETATADPDEQLVVVETSENQHSRLPLMPEVRAKAAAGQLVYHWPANKPADQAKVAVYRWLRPPTTPTASQPSPPAGGGE